MKLKKGDTVKIVRGKDKGKNGKIERVFPQIKKVLVANVNQFKRHLKARSQNQASEIVTITKPLPEASVLFICPKCSKTSRIGYVYEKGVKSRVCINCKSAV